MAMINRDPFARQELHRSRKYVVSAACAWCGCVHATASGRTYLYQYRVESDGGRKFPDRTMYCSIACRRSELG